MRFSDSVAEGDSAETRFVIDYLKQMGRPNSFVFSDAYQNMKEHWDLSIDDLKIDVKARRRKSRRSEYVDDVLIFEILNVNGSNGWGRGKADAIAYETSSDWLVIDREMLLSHCERSMEVFRDSSPSSTYKAPYYPQSRNGRSDLFCWVPIGDAKRFLLFSIPK